MERKYFVLFGMTAAFLLFPTFAHAEVLLLLRFFFYFFLLVFVFLSYLLLSIPVLYFLFRGFKTRGKFGQCPSEELLLTGRAFWISFKTFLFPGLLYFFPLFFSGLAITLVFSESVNFKNRANNWLWFVLLGSIFFGVSIVTVHFL